MSQDCENVQRGQQRPVALDGKTAMDCLESILPHICKPASKVNAAKALDKLRRLLMELFPGANETSINKFISSLQRAAATECHENARVVAAAERGYAEEVALEASLKTLVQRGLRLATEPTTSTSTGKVAVQHLLDLTSDLFKVLIQPGVLGALLFPVAAFASKVETNGAADAFFIKHPEFWPMVADWLLQLGEISAVMDELEVTVPGALLYLSGNVSRFVSDPVSAAAKVVLGAECAMTKEEAAAWVRDFKQHRGPMLQRRKEALDVINPESGVEEPLRSELGRGLALEDSSVCLSTYGLARIAKLINSGWGPVQRVRDVMAEDPLNIGLGGFSPHSVLGEAMQAMRLVADEGITAVLQSLEQIWNSPTACAFTETTNHAHAVFGTLEPLCSFVYLNKSMLPMEACTNLPGFKVALKELETAKGLAQEIAAEFKGVVASVTVNITIACAKLQELRAAVSAGDEVSAEAMGGASEILREQLQRYRRTTQINQSVSMNKRARCLALLDGADRGVGSILSNQLRTWEWALGDLRSLLVRLRAQQAVLVGGASGAIMQPAGTPQKPGQPHQSPNKEAANGRQDTQQRRAAKRRRSTEGIDEQDAELGHLSKLRSGRRRCSNALQGNGAINSRQARAEEPAAGEPGDLA